MKIVKIQNEIKLISTLKSEDIKKLEKANMNSVKSEEDKTMFAITSKGNLNKYGIPFPETTDDGYGMLTLYDSDSNAEDAVERFVEEYIHTIAKAKEVEAILQNRLAGLNKATSELLESIQTVRIEGGNTVD